MQKVERFRGLLCNNSDGILRDLTRALLHKIGQGPELTQLHDEPIGVVVDAHLKQFGNSGVVTIQHKSDFVLDLLLRIVFVHFNLLQREHLSGLLLGLDNVNGTAGTFSALSDLLVQSQRIRLLQCKTLGVALEVLLRRQPHSLVMHLHHGHHLLLVGLGILDGNSVLGQHLRPAVWQPLVPRGVQRVDLDVSDMLNVAGLRNATVFLRRTSSEQAANLLFHVVEGLAQRSLVSHPRSFRNTGGGPLPPIAHVQL
mmetsp:Transcript_19827/g.50394  ORF Transcript_19827/g.50394 Transcript_19827/m.50394 type:complete len:255 (-) Transcript_19827:57-821(-)